MALKAKHGCESSWLLPVRCGPSYFSSGLAFLSVKERKVFFAKSKNTDFAGLLCELVEREGSRHSMHHE